MSGYVRLEESSLLIAEGPPPIMKGEKALNSIVRAVAAILVQQTSIAGEDLYLFGDIHFFRHDPRYVRSQKQKHFTLFECRKVIFYIKPQFHVLVIPDNEMVDPRDESVVYLFRRACIAAGGTERELSEKYWRNEWTSDGANAMLLISKTARRVLSAHIENLSFERGLEALARTPKEPACCCSLL